MEEIRKAILLTPICDSNKSNSNTSNVAVRLKCISVIKLLTSAMHPIVLTQSHCCTSILSLHFWVAPFICVIITTVSGWIYQRLSFYILFFSARDVAINEDKNIRLNVVTKYNMNSALKVGVCLPCNLCKGTCCGNSFCPNLLFCVCKLARGLRRSELKGLCFIECDILH